MKLGCNKGLLKAKIKQCVSGLKMWGMISLRSLVEIPSGPWLLLLCIPPRNLSTNSSVTLQKLKVLQSEGGRYCSNALGSTLSNFLASSGPTLAKNSLNPLAIFKSPITCSPLQLNVDGMVSLTWDFSLAFPNQPPSFP